MNSPSASADQTPAAAPVDPAVTPEVPPSETPAKKARFGKRTSVRALRMEIADLTQRTAAINEVNGTLRMRLNETRTERNTAEDKLYEANDKAAAAERTVVSLRTALEFVLAIAVLDKSPSEATELLPKKAREFGFNFDSISSELLDALGKAYAKAPQRIVKATADKALASITDMIGALVKGGPAPRGVRTVSGSGLDSLMETMLGLGDPGATDPLSAILGGDCGNPNCPVHGNRR